MKTFSMIYITVLLNVSSTIVFAEVGENSGASYIRMGVGARALSMGGAFTAVANDFVW